MGVKKLKPTSPGRRFPTVSDFDTITKSLSSRHRSTKLRWPSCRYPIVGTRPMVLPASRFIATSSLTSEIDLTSFTVFPQSVLVFATSASAPAPRARDSTTTEHVH